MTTPRLLSLGLFSVLALVSLSAAPADSASAAAPAPIPLNGLSVSEVAQLNSAMKKLLVTQDPSVQAIFDANPNGVFFRPNSAIVPTPYQPARHDAFVEIAKKGDIDLLFDGDSITDFWRVDDPTTKHNGKAVFDKYFGSLKVANFGISGDTTQGVLYRLQNGEGQGFQPKAIMLMIGTNNVSGRDQPTAPQVADGIICDVNEMRKDFPNAKILLLGIFPRGVPTDPMRKTIADINTIISKLDDEKHIFYMDIGPKFLNADGVITPDIMSEASPLHPTEHGYEIWAEAVKDKLAELMK
jgi:lysophospholipase L1-like esterase